MPSEPALAPPIPESELRHFHTFLKRFSSNAFHDRIVAELLSYPAELDDMLGRSVEQCKTFSADVPWHEGRGPSGFTPKMENSSEWANQLVIALGHQQREWPGHGLSFTFIDYEIVPFRETGEAGRQRHSSPRAITGRLDALLATLGEKHPVPVIVEVKAVTDAATPLRTLIQVLSYAAELGTPTQRARLGRCYQGRFASYEEQPRVDLCVMKQTPVDPSADKQKDLDKRQGSIQDLCVKLLQQPNTSALVRRIIWLHPQVDSLGDVTFEHRFTCTAATS